MKGKAITNVTGAYANSHPLWRHTAKSPQEATMWMAQTTASGMIPWYHWLGGAPEDLRWRETGRKFFQWIAREREALCKSRVSHESRRRIFRAHEWVLQSTRRKRMRRSSCRDFTTLCWRAVFFLTSYMSRISPAATLKKYSALLLPNVATLSDAQCTQIREYVRSGGSLLATFETSRYDEWGTRRSRLGLADVFGIEAAADVQVQTEIRTTRGSRALTRFCEVSKTRKCCRAQSIVCREG